MVSGRPTIFGKNEDDQVRPENWKYQWFGWNDTNR
jgi:hypothetical protein